MRTSLETVTVETFTSDVDASVTSTDPHDAEVIAWADAHPETYAIVTSTRSKAWGIGSTHYLGWAQRGTSPVAVLHRLAVLRRVIEEPASDFFAWSARFTLEAWGKGGGKGGRLLKGGFFQQHAQYADGKVYARQCATLDYTTATLEEVVDRFLVWAGEMYSPTTHVTLDGETVRALDLSSGSADERTDGRADP